MANCYKRLLPSEAGCEGASCTPPGTPPHPRQTSSIKPNLTLTLIGTPAPTPDNFHKEEDMRYKYIGNGQCTNDLGHEAPHCSSSWDLAKIRENGYRICIDICTRMGFEKCKGYNIRDSECRLYIKTADIPTHYLGRGLRDYAFNYFSNCKSQTTHFNIQGVMAYSAHQTSADTAAAATHYMNRPTDRCFAMKPHLEYSARFGKNHYGFVGVGYCTNVDGRESPFCTGHVSHPDQCRKLCDDSECLGYSTQQGKGGNYQCRLALFQKNAPAGESYSANHIVPITT